MNEYSFSGYAVYCELMFSDDGLVMDKSCERGFAWPLKGGEFDTSNLFGRKNVLRCLKDKDLVKRYVTECINLGMETKVYAVFSPDDNERDFEKETRIINVCDYLGYDLVSPDMDYSPVYEAMNTNVYGKAGFALCENFKNKINSQGYIENEEDLNIFLKERYKIINSFCNLYSQEKIDIVVDGEKKNSKTKEFVFGKFYICHNIFENE